MRIPFIAAAIAVAYLPLANAFDVPHPCDSVTSSGWVAKDGGAKATFSADGGCKNGAFDGHVEYKDHEFNFYLKSTRITGYTFDSSNPNARGICGKARVNSSAIEVNFRVHVEDNGEPGKNDRFGILVDHFSSPDGFYRVLSRKLGGGNVQLLKPTKASRAPLDVPFVDATDCAGVPQPEEPR